MAKVRYATCSACGSTDTGLPVNADLYLCTEADTVSWIAGGRFTAYDSMTDSQALVEVERRTTSGYPSEVYPFGIPESEEVRDMQ